MDLGTLLLALAAALLAALLVQPLRHEGRRGLKALLLLLALAALPLQSFTLMVLPAAPEMLARHGTPPPPALGSETAGTRAGGAVAAAMGAAAAAAAAGAVAALAVLLQALQADPVEVVAQRGPQRRRRGGARLGDRRGLGRP